MSSMESCRCYATSSYWHKHKGETVITVHIVWACPLLENWPIAAAADRKSTTLVSRKVLLLMQVLDFFRPCTISQVPLTADQACRARKLLRIQKLFQNFNSKDYGSCATTINNIKKGMREQQIVTKWHVHKRAVGSKNNRLLKAPFSHTALCFAVLENSTGFSTSHCLFLLSSAGNGVYLLSTFQHCANRLTNRWSHLQWCQNKSHHRFASRLSESWHRVLW